MKLSDKRKRYYTMIWVYKKRREDLRKQFGIKTVHSHKPLPKEYLERSKGLNEKIRSWNREIRRIDILTGRINQLEKTVFEFTGEKIINQKGYKVPQPIKIAKYLYYKFGLESGIRAKELREYIQITLIREPTRYRSRFTKSFETNPKNKEIWHRFKNFYKETLKVA